MREEIGHIRRPSSCVVPSRFQEDPLFLFLPCSQALLSPRSSHRILPWHGQTGYLIIQSLTFYVFNFVLLPVGIRDGIVTWVIGKIWSCLFLRLFFFWQLLEKALEECGNDLDSAIRSLNELRLGASVDKSVESAAAIGSDVAVDLSAHHQSEGMGKKLLDWYVEEMLAERCVFAF